MKTQIFAQNIKCNGCTLKIQNAIGRIDGIESIEVIIESGEIIVNYKGELDKRNIFIEKLEAIGFPEKLNSGSNNPFEF